MTNSNWKPVKMGNIEIEFPVGLAPMAGITDEPFRKICTDLGAGFVVSEMISGKALTHNNLKTKKMLHSSETGMVGLQLFGSDPAIFSQVIEELNDHPCDFFDINMGCPAPKIVKNNEGAALMKDPRLVEKIVLAATKVSQKPVTIKIRKGFNYDDINGIEIAQIAENAGAAAIFIHGRTRSEFYAGKADWEYIRQMKEKLTIPVFGNGDVTDVQSAGEIREVTTCDGIIIGRAAQGNPWLFNAIRHNNYWLEKQHIDSTEKCAIMKKHLNLQLAYTDEWVALREMRKHLSWYLKGQVGAAAMRQAINQATTVESVMKLIESIS